MRNSLEIYREIERLKKEAKEVAAAEARAAREAREARKPKEPSIGSVIRFEKAQGGRVYMYAARSFPISGSAQRRWAITNTVVGAEGRYTWNGLLEFIGEANWSSIQRATGWVDQIDLANEPAVVERVGEYGRVEATEEVRPVSPFEGGRY